MINILKTEDVKFMISDTQYIKINNKSIQDDVCEQCTQTDIDYVDETSGVCLRFGYDDIDSICQTMVNSDQFKKLINGTNILDLSINSDLGFEYNECYNKGITFKYFKDCWFEGNRHKQIRPYYDSWLYNDKDGNIIFEITPFYPGHSVNKKTFPDRIPYKEWIKDYKPIIKVMIPKENVKQWIKQAKGLTKAMKWCH